MDSGEARLVELGYKQVLRRKLTRIGTFALSFSILSVLVGPVGLYGYGYNNGGPATITWGWAIVSIFTCIICASMCEIASAYPTAGGLYFWADHLIPEKHARFRPLASWLTGYFNLIGQIVGCASVFFTTAQLICLVIQLAQGGAQESGSWAYGRRDVVLITGALYVLGALYNCLPIESQQGINVFSAIWQLAISLLVIVVLPAVAVKHQSAKFVYGTFKNQSAGIDSNVYVFLIGLLMAQYTLSGYDGAFHVSEESQSSDRTTPATLMTAMVAATTLGFAFLSALTFSIQNPETIGSGGADTGGASAAGQIFWDAFQSRYNSGTGAVVLLSFITLANWLCANSLLTSNARMVFAFSRDGAIPGSRLWHTVTKNGVPLFAVWFSAVFGFLFVIPYIWSLTAYFAVTSIATIALYLTYGIPIFLRTFVTRGHFQKGPFNLGPFSYLFGWISCIWIAFITVIFVLPVAYPVTRDTFNYASAAVGGWATIVLVYWVLSGRKWFVGPRANMDLGEKPEHTIMT